MPPRKPRGGMRGRGRGRGRGASSGRGRRKRLPSSTSITTPENSDDECTSTNGNVSISPQFTGKKQAEYNEERELSLPRLKCTAAPENSTFLSLLSCENHDYVMTDDELDHVQWDLELMLTSIILRRNIVRDELSTFAAMQFTHSLNRTTKNPILPTIRPRAAAEISPVNECRKMKVDFDPTSKELPPNKTESANRFWSLVEPYLAHAKEEDLNWLEDLIKSYSPNKKLYEIPPLGEHYAMNWAKEELEIQKNQSSCSPRLSKKLKITERISPNVVELVTKVNSAIHDDNVYTPIYQRVVSALVEHTHSSIEDLDEHFPEFDDEDNQQEMSNTCKEFYAEQDIKKQLCKLGLMSDSSKSEEPPAAETLPSIDKSDEDHDEILEEIMKCDNSLTQLREINKNHLIELLNRCRNDYYQQIIKKKMENVNKEIINYKINQNEALAKEKKVVQTSEEEDDLNYLLDQRSNYLLQLQSLLFESNSYLSSSVSDNSESSDEESDPSKVHIKTELSEASEHDTSVNDMDQNDKMDYEYQNEENIENDVKINIKQERMECDQENDANGEYNEQVIDINIDEKVSIEEEHNVSNEINETVNIIENKNEQDVFIQQDNINEEGTSNTVISTDKYHRKLKKSNFKNEHTFEIESRRPIKVIQESIKYESEVDPSETIMDDVKRDLRSQKLNDTIYFEPYDGTSSDESDFTDILE